MNYVKNYHPKINKHISIYTPLIWQVPSSSIYTTCMFQKSNKLPTNYQIFPKNN